MSSNTPEIVSYNAVNPRYTPHTVYSKVDPTVNNWRGFRLLDEWLNTATKTWWKLVSLDGNQALWIKSNSSSIAAVLDFIVPNGTSPVYPDLTGNVTLTSSDNTVTITGSTNTIDFSANGSGLINWVVVTAASQAMANSTGYFGNRAGTIAFTLPTTSIVGDEVRISSVQGLWTIAQSAGQQIRLGNLDTTLGAGGSIASTSVGDAIHLVCWTANTLWSVVDNPVGVLAVT